MKVDIKQFFINIGKLRSKSFRKQVYDLAVVWSVSIASFSFLLIVYLIATFFKAIGRFKFFPKLISRPAAKVLAPLYQKIIKLTAEGKGTISRIDLIELAIRNMYFKKNRSFITIGGMALGIGAIVFLVSLGYGVNKLVVDKVARLEELEQLDVTPQTGSNIKINGQIIKDFQQIENVTKVLPQIAVVSKVNFQNSVADMAVYGVTTDYLKQSAIKTIAGELFESNEVNLDSIQQIAPTQTSQASESADVITKGRKISDVDYQIEDFSYIEVRAEPNLDAEVIGYTKRVDEDWQDGQEYLGQSYFSEGEEGQIAQNDDGSWLGKWLKDEFALWQQSSCDPNDSGCTAGVFQEMTNDDQSQVFQSGFIKSSTADIKKSETEILGTSVEVASTSAFPGQKNADVEFVIYPQSWVRVRETPSLDAKVVGYTRRAEGVNAGEEVWGDEYLDDAGRGNFYNPDLDKMLGKWVQAPVKLWQKEKCDKENPDCVNQEYLVIRDEQNLQAQIDGFMAEENMDIKDMSIKYPSVLGVSIDTEEYVLGDSDYLLAQANPDDEYISQDEWVEIASEAGVVAPVEKMTVDFGENSLREAVVNVSMLKILGLTEQEAIGKTFESSFVVVGDLLDTNYQIESESVEYKIVGVVPEDKAPFFYVPFNDLQQMGIRNFSQAKIVVNDKEDLPAVRTEIESKGFSTSSVVDTVAQIDSLFGTIRSVLALLGMVALAVASLGMFNTLTVSLLERTREVGLMKAMGMKSYEVRELFLTESMVMGFFGGFFGIIFGFSAGKILGVALSIFSLSKGQGLIDISFIPFMFVTTVFLLSLTVGIFTGIYPARRATKISALNALRYE